MKITVKYYREITKDEMYTLALLGAEVELHWLDGKAYKIEYWLNGKKLINSIWN